MAGCILRETPEAGADARERLGDGRRRAEVDVLARLHGRARGTGRVADRGIRRSLERRRRDDLHRVG